MLITPPEEAIAKATATFADYAETPTTDHRDAFIAAVVGSADAMRWLVEAGDDANRLKIQRRLGSKSPLRPAFAAAVEELPFFSIDHDHSLYDFCSAFGIEPPSRLQPATPQQPELGDQAEIDVVTAMFRSFRRTGTAETLARRLVGNEQTLRWLLGDYPAAPRRSLTLAGETLRSDPVLRAAVDHELRQMVDDDLTPEHAHALERLRTQFELLPDDSISFLNAGSGIEPLSVSL
jgi:hypothetical protein